MRNWIIKYSKYIAFFLALGFVIPLNEQFRKTEEEIEEIELNLEWCSVDNHEAEKALQEFFFDKVASSVFPKKTLHNFSFPPHQFVKTSHYKLFILYSCLMVDRSVA